jgi:hypothetical protein
MAPKMKKIRVAVEVQKPAPFDHWQRPATFVALPTLW